MGPADLLLAYYRDTLYIFGICPCCGEIFNLSQSVIRLRRRPVKLPRYDHLLNAQGLIDDKEQEVERVEGRYGERLDAFTEREEEFKYVEPEIIRKVKVQGRRQAMNRIKKIDKVFTRKNIDPRDIRVICSPVEFVSFNGMTESREIDSIEFINRRPASVPQERSLGSVEKTIKKGNVEFVLIRVSDDGTVTHTSAREIERQLNSPKRLYLRP